MTEALDPLGPDWIDVVRRSRRALRRRRVLQGVAVLAAAVAGVASAYALGHPVVDFHQASHAGLKQVNEFGSMDVGAPRGMAPGVLPHETRRIASVRIDGKVHVLYVAPTRQGGFCDLWSNLGGGCRANRHVKWASRLEAGGLEGTGGLEVLEGSFFQAQGDRLTLAFRDGATVDVPFIWVTAPIDAGFYLYRVPNAHRHVATRAVSLSLYDKDGKLIAREPIMRPEPRPSAPPQRLRGFPALMIPVGGIWSERRQLFDLRDWNGQRVGLWVMPKRGGGQCFVTNTAGGCGDPSAQTANGVLLPLGFTGTRLCCGASPKIVRVEARFQDGSRVSLYPKEGYLIYPIPREHFALGHRLVSLVGYDAAGKAIARGRVPAPADQGGIYPCKSPKSLGYGVKRCA